MKKYWKNLKGGFKLDWMYWNHLDDDGDGDGDIDSNELNRSTDIFLFWHYHRFYAILDLPRQIFKVIKTWYIYVNSRKNQWCAIQTRK